MQGARLALHHPRGPEASARPQPQSELQLPADGAVQELRDGLAHQLLRQNSLPCHPEAATEERPGDPGQPDRPHAGLLPQELCQPLCRQPADPAETMKVFPVYMNSLMRTAPLVGSTELSTDDRAHQRLAVMAMGVEDTQLLLYPRLIPLHNMELEGEAVPSPLRCSEDRLSDGGAFLLENGHALFLWLGQACPPELIQGLFNLPSLAHLQPNTIGGSQNSV
ncbi:protein transport protein Sec24D-like [Gadus chalcogrammus]|uniref:protein transport protein Sec24D-like n=1 Tax=Gadus chalcogrammus TaxID=1042646 RepID=UPI0024C48BBC|nr:protein transport protein Sec24D-like [Gadus chalcogrammus]